MFSLQCLIHSEEIMDPKLENFLIGIIPTVASIIRDLFNKTGELPTDAQIIAKLQTDSDGIAAIGDSWLANHPQ
jgi:hypothetical protein